MPKLGNPLLRRKKSAAAAASSSSASLASASSSSSPFSTALRTKPGSRKSRLADKEEDERLDDVGIVPRMSTTAQPDVISVMRYVQENTFEDIPDRAAGMNSQQVAETLRFRAALPPIVSLAHLYALSASPTAAERELASLIAAGKVRKITIPGRGKGGAAVGEGVAVVEDWEQRVRQNGTLEDEVKDKYIALLRAHPASQTVTVHHHHPHPHQPHQDALSQGELRSLVTAGFMTHPAALSSSVGDVFAGPSRSAAGAIASAGSRAATGTLAAVGGRGAVHNSGGGGNVLATRATRPTDSERWQQETAMMTFSLPATGAYLRLLTEARLHLLFLLKQLAPRYKEATRALLEEKWNGNVLGDAISQAKRARGQWSGVLPGQTKRWRQFSGLRFEWVLAECMGSGLVELFDTGSVGMGVRAV